MEAVALQNQVDTSLGAARKAGAGHRRVWLGLALAAMLCLCGYGIYWRFAARRGAPLDGAKFQAIAPVDMQFKIDKDGELEAVNNIDVMCLVEGGSTIVQIVKEGAMVKKGQVLVVLDSSLIRQKMDDATLVLQTAEADATTAREMQDIQESQNAANLEAAQVDLELAKIALSQYEDGTYPQDVENAKTTLAMAKITVADKNDDLRQTRELYAKNFVTLADVKAAELALTTVENDEKKAEAALMVLTTYTHKMDSAGKKSYLAQAEQKLARTRNENAINLAQKKADARAKAAKLALLQRQYAHLQEQLDACTIKAPADGLAIYAVLRNSSSNNPIQEGTQVRERQDLLLLPDTSSMKAVIKINESQVSRLRLGQKAIVHITGVEEPVGAVLTKVSPVADSGQRFWNPDLREYPVELTLDYTPPDLKPGISVRAEVQIQDIPDALSVPLAALYSRGPDNFVFVRDGQTAKPQRVTIGESNDTHARVLDGISAGQEVLLLSPGQGRDLLDKAGIELATTAEERPHVREKQPEPPKVADPAPQPGMSDKAAAEVPRHQT